MAYITVDEVKVQYPGLTEQLDRGTVVEARVERWISQSERLVDAKVGLRYEIPFTTNPPLIVAMAYELFEYYWQKDIYTPTSTGDEVPWIYARYDRVLRILVQIGGGLLPLFDANNLRIDPSAEKLKTLRSNHIDVDQIFTMKDPWEQTIDADYSTEPEA